MGRDPAVVADPDARPRRLAFDQLQRIGLGEPAQQIGGRRRAQIQRLPIAALRKLQQRRQQLRQRRFAQSIIEPAHAGLIEIAPLDLRRFDEHPHR